MKMEYDNGNGAEGASLFKDDIEMQPKYESANDTSPGNGATLEHTLGVSGQQYRQNTGFDVNEEAMYDARMDHQMETIRKSRNTRNQVGNEHFAGIVNDYKTENLEELLETVLRNAVGPIGPVRNVVYKTAKLFGKDLVRSRLIKYQENAKKEVKAQKESLDLLSGELQTEYDNDENVHPAEKGLIGQGRQYRETCEGLVHELNKIEATYEGITRGIEENKQKIAELHEGIKNDPGNEDISAKLSFYQGRNLKLKKDLDELADQKIEGEDELQMYSELEDTITANVGIYHLFTADAKNTMTTAIREIALLDVYLKNYDNFEGIVGIYKRTLRIQKGTQQLAEINGQLHGVTLKGAKAAAKESERIRSDTKRHRQRQEIKNETASRGVERKSQIEELKARYS